MEERSGLVIKSTGNSYRVVDSLSKEPVECRLPGRFRLRGSRTTSPVVVGDRVRYRCEKAGEGSILEIAPRRNYIIRRASNLSKESHILAANLDQAFLVVTLAWPETNLEFVDRFLVTAEAYHIPVTLLLNKVDLYMLPALEARREAFVGIYTDAGYEVIELSAGEGEVTGVHPPRLRKAAVSSRHGSQEGENEPHSARSLPADLSAQGGGAERVERFGSGVELLRERMRSRVTLLSGNSGVGKSTLLRAVDPTLEVRVGAVSDAHHKGKHTTTFSEMFPLREGGYLIDTPGIKGFGLIDIEGGEICRYFPELFRLSAGCSYHNCSHTHEPGCAVKEALERGEISVSRYESYLKLLADDEKYRR